jgi:nicotinamide-nucleotide amidase
MPYKLDRRQALAVVGNIRRAIQTYFADNGLTYAVFGKSEGLDSSVIAGLLADIPGVRPIGVIMPCESDPAAEVVARIVLDHFGVPFIRVDLTAEFHALMARYYAAGGVHDQLCGILADRGEIEQRRLMSVRKSRAAGNIKVRLRMITLYHIAQLSGGLVVSTDNLSEFWMGFWTLCGDVGDLSPIQHLWKGLELYAVAEALGVPEASIQAVPTDGLDVLPGGTDQDQLGLPYPDLDRVIVRLLQENFRGGRDLPEKDANDLFARVAAETALPLEAVRHAAGQLAGTHFKRHWPHEVTREENGLPRVGEMNVLD